MSAAIEVNYIWYCDLDLLVSFKGYVKAYTFTKHL